MGNNTGDDAAVYRINDETALILTVDFFTPITDDPYEFGSIAAANSLSDVYAMGGKPLLALNVVGFPVDLAKEMLPDVLLGGHDKATEAGCMIVGGHTVDDTEPKYGLSVVGIVKPGRQTSNAGAQPGDQLILTKPIGTGIIATGAKQQKVDPDVMKNAVKTMATLNKAAAEAMMEVGVNSCTDVTGFGLMGHLRGMVKASGVAAQIRYRDVPLLPGAWDLLNQGVVPGGTYRNMQQVADTVLWNEEITEEQKLMLCDAQTSGGLLISVPGSKANQLLIRLQAAGVPISAVVGKITGGAAGTIEVIP